MSGQFARYISGMTPHDLRTAIGGRMDEFGVTAHHAAALAGLPKKTVRLYLSDEREPAVESVLKLAAAVGLAVRVEPVPGFEPAPTRPRGRPKKASKGGG